MYASTCTLHLQGADVNAAPVPSSKDTALTIAADKGHYKFVELILRHGAYVDVKNKKGNSPLWLAANGKLPQCVACMHTMCPAWFEAATVRSEPLLSLILYSRRSSGCD